MAEPTQRVPDPPPQYVKRPTVRYEIPSGVQGDVITIYLPVPMQPCDIKSLARWVKLISSLVRDEMRPASVPPEGDATETRHG